MKIFIGILLAVNLLLAYWVLTEPDPGLSHRAEKARNMPPLQRLSEVPRQVQLSTSNAEVEASEVEQDNTPVLAQASGEPVQIKPSPRVVFLELSCYSIGPFHDEKAVKSASSTLMGLGLVTSYKSEVRKELSGYWVYIPPLPSRDEARKVTVMLKQRGLKDFLIVSSGEKRNAISLGFFSTRDGAQQHHTRMKAIGLNSVLEEAYKEIKGYWLDFSSPNTPALPESVIEALQSEYDEISIKKRPCQ